jgi:hypothetical protein
MKHTLLQTNTFFSLLCFLTFLSLTYSVKAEIFIGKGTIVLGSDMTEIQALELLKIQCERDASEQAGIYIQSKSKILNNVLIEDVITICAADILNKKSFNSERTIANGIWQLNGKGTYNIDLTDVKTKIEKLSQEASLRDKLAEVTENYQTLMLNLMRTKNYDDRRELLRQVEEQRLKGKEIFIGDEVKITLERRANIVNEWRNKLSLLEQSTTEQSQFQIDSTNIVKDSIDVFIAYTRIYDTTIVQKLDEILRFAHKSGILEEQPFSFTVDKSFVPLSINGYNKSGNIVESIPVSIFTILVDTIITDHGNNRFIFYGNLNCHYEYMGIMGMFETNFKEFPGVKIMMNRLCNEGIVRVKIPLNSQIDKLRLEALAFKDTGQSKK